MELKIAYLIHIKRVPAPLPEEKVRTHDLTFVHSGEFVYEIDGERFSVKSGEAMLCPKGRTRRRFESGEVFYTSINFNGDIDLKLPAHMILSDSPEISYCLKRLLSVYGGGEEEPELSRCSAYLSLILCELWRLNRAEDENDYIRRVRGMVKADPAAKLTVAELADAVHLNASYLSTLWKRECGVTLGEFRLGCQIELAEKLLCEDSATIRSVAERAGFCDVYYFSRIFRSRVGMTPSDYRRAMLSAGEMTEKKIETIERSKPRKKITD